MQTQIYDKSCKTDAAISVQYAAVVQGASDGSVAMPGAANAAKFLGFAQTLTTAAGQSCAVRMLGISRAIAKGVIAAGDRVAINGTGGDVISKETVVEAGLAGTATVVYTVGIALTTSAVDGDLIDVWIAPQEIPLAVS